MVSLNYNFWNQFITNQNLLTVFSNEKNFLNNECCFLSSTKLNTIRRIYTTWKSKKGTCKTFSCISLGGKKKKKNTICSCRHAEKKSLQQLSLFTKTALKKKSCSTKYLGVTKNVFKTLATLKLTFKCDPMCYVEWWSLRLILLKNICN